MSKDGVGCKAAVLIFLALGPIVLSPLLAVQFPRIIAYTPAIAGIFGAIILWLGYNTRTAWSKSAIIVCLGTLVLAALSILWSQSAEASIDRVQKLSLLLPVFVLTLSVIPTALDMLPERLSGKALHWIFKICGLAAAFTAFELLFKYPVYSAIRGMEDLSGFSSAVYNRGAVTMTLMALPAFLYLRQAELKSKWACLYLPLLAIIAMLCLVQSQSAQLAFIAGLGFYWIFPATKRWAWFALFGVLALGCLAKPFAVGTAFDAMPRDIQKTPVLKEAYIGDRLEIWDFVSRKALESPIIGHGIEFTKTVERFDTQKVFAQSESVLHPHSFILQIWMEFGVIGILIFLAGAACLMKRIYQMPDDVSRRIALTSMMTTILVASFSYGMWQSWWLGLLCLITLTNMIGMRSAKK